MRWIQTSSRNSRTATATTPAEADTMGWGLSDDGTSVIGDGPVDSVMDAQREIEAQRQRRGVAPPSAEALYDAAGRVLRRESIGVPTPPDDWPSGPREWTDAELPVLGEALRDA